MSTAVFPTLAGLEYPVVRTPIFSTLIQTSAAGFETRARLQLYPRWQWTLSFNFLRDDSNNEFRTLVGFFLARGGSFDSFLFNDVDDNAVTGQPIGVGDGSNKIFQLVRSFGGFTEPVLQPLFVTVKKNGVTTTAWTFAGSGPGQITFATAPANGVVITADLTYQWPVRFLANQYDFSKFMDRLWEQKKLDFISVKNL
jgi:uncharacterized protein (TIGR02217 family)